MKDTLQLNVTIERNGNPLKCKIELPYLVAKKEMAFATLIVDISFFPEKYKASSGYVQKILNDIYEENLTEKECDEILNKYRGMGIMSGEISKSFDNIASIFVKHCLSMCKINNKGKLITNTYTPTTEQAMLKMLENNCLLNEIFQYINTEGNIKKIGKINLTTMRPELL